MKNIFNKFMIAVLFVAGMVANGQVPPPPMPQEEAGDIGVPTNVSVDMHIALLAIIAVIFIAYFVREQYRKKIA